LNPIAAVLEAELSSITSPAGVQEHPYEYDRQGTFRADSGNLQEIRAAESDPGHDEADTRNSRLLAVVKQHDSAAGGYSSDFIL
jgi:hypothetical protein